MKRNILLGLVGLTLLAPAVVQARTNFTNYRDQEILYFVYYSQSNQTKAAAIRELGKRHVFYTEEYLLGLCYDSNREIRTAAIQALGMMGSSKSFDTMFFIVWDESGYFGTWEKQSAVWALNRLPSVSYLYLTYIMNMHPDLKVSFTAANELSKRSEAGGREAAASWRVLLDMVNLKNPRY